MKKNSHIDTLYLSCNCNLTDYYAALNILCDYKMIGNANGRQWYNLDYCRIGHLDWDICQDSKNYPFLIQYSFEYLYQNNFLLSISNLKLPFINVALDKYLVKRIDYNVTIQSDINILDKIFVSSYFKKWNNWGTNSTDVETINLGLRKTGKTFRIYNKTKELSDKKNLIKCDMLKQNFGNLKNLYSCEVELHRKYILDRTDCKGTLLDWHELISMCKKLLGSIRYCDRNDKNIKNLKSKHYDRIIFTYLTSFLGDIRFITKDKYDKSRINMLDTIIDILSQYNSYGGEELSNEELGSLIFDYETIKKVNSY